MHINSFEGGKICTNHLFLDLQIHGSLCNDSVYDCCPSLSSRIKLNRFLVFMGRFSYSCANLFCHGSNPSCRKAIKASSWTISTRDSNDCVSYWINCNSTWSLSSAFWGSEGKSIQWEGSYWSWGSHSKLAMRCKYSAILGLSISAHNNKYILQLELSLPLTYVQELTVHVFCHCEHILCILFHQLKWAWVVEYCIFLRKYPWFIPSLASFDCIRKLLNHILIRKNCSFLHLRVEQYEDS